MDLFVYGTLMFPDVWRGVTGREFAGRRAQVAGYARYRVRDGVYPVMTPAAAECRVAGLVHFDIDDRALDRLDRYESDLYDRVTVAATLGGGEILACQAYVLPPHRAHESSGEPWDADAFRRDHLAAYLQRLA